MQPWGLKNSSLARLSVTGYWLELPALALGLLVLMLWRGHSAFRILAVPLREVRYIHRMRTIPLLGVRYQDRGGAWELAQTLPALEE